MSWEWGYTSYTSASERRRRAERAAKKLAKGGTKLQPIEITGSKIASSFWGKSWCMNLESYSDYSNRLPRGRSYVRGGAVIDLQITPGVIEAQVSGSSLYDITVEIDAVRAPIWDALKTESAGQIGSMFDLLQGKLSAPVMELMTRKVKGLFPHPHEINFGCSCPDSASMCKHIAAVLYGVGARLDDSPELLFVLRGVDHLELVAGATQSVTAGASAAATIACDSLADVFGIDINLADISLPATTSALEPARLGKKSKPASTKPSKTKAEPAKAKPAKAARPSKKPKPGSVARKPAKPKVTALAKVQPANKPGNINEFPKLARSTRTKPSIERKKGNANTSAKKKTPPRSRRLPI